MAKTLADPLFRVGPNDKLATVDVYTGSPNVITNAISSFLSGINPQLGNLLKGGGSIASLIPVIKTLASGEIKISKDALASKILGATLQGVVQGDLKAAFQNLPALSQSAILDALPGGREAVASLGGSLMKITSGNIASISDIGKAVQEFTNGNFKFGLIDKGAIGTVISGIVKDATGVDLKGTLTALTSGITDKGLLQGAIKDLLPFVVAKSDSGLLAELSKTLLKADLMDLSPGLIRDFLSNYKLPFLGSDFSFNDLSKEWNQIRTAFDSVGGLWDVSTRLDAPTPYLSDFTGASADAKKLLRTLADEDEDFSDDKLKVLAAEFPVQDVHASLIRAHPVTLFEFKLALQ